jgi:hypothetical protein
VGGRRANHIYCWNVQKPRYGERSFLTANGGMSTRKYSGRQSLPKNATEQRNLGVLAYKIIGKWESQAKKAERWLGERTNENVCGNERL